MLAIRLLGPPQLTLNDQPLTLPRRKSRAVIYYLATHPRPVTREHLLAFFWPDLDRRAAQQTLRTTLHGLRKALGPTLIVDDDSLSLAPDVEVDVRLFESHLQPPISDLPALLRTLALYRGEFLESFSLPDSPAFDDWAAVERERYRRLSVRGLTALAAQHEANRDFAAALDALDRALASDPLQEDLQRAAMRLDYLVGDRAGAVRRYDALRQLLDDEMGVPPMAETRAVYDAIITDKLPVPSRPPPAADLRPPAPNSQSPISTLLPFSGRAAELRALQELASHETNKFAFIEGEPGIGKTRLAEEFLQTLNPLSLIGKGRELEQTLPYQPVIEALRGLLARPDWPALQATLREIVPPLWLAETARLLPELAPSGRATPETLATTDESRLWEGLYQFLLALARQHFAVFFLDDLHWADASTFALLGYLVRRKESGPTGAPILFLGAARHATPRSAFASFLQALTREGRVAHINLMRFTPDETLALAQLLSPAHPQPLAEWLTRASEGNPYILVELVRHARANGLLLPDGTLNLGGLSASPVVPQTVYTLIQSRLAQLSEAARRVLDVAVAVGREFEFEVVARAAALSEETALDALDELREVGLIYPSRDDPAGRLYTFDHSLTMEVAYREIGDPRHRLLHRRVAEAMERLYRPRLDSVAGQLAQHFAEGDDPQRAAPYARRAGQLAARLAAWAEAIAFYEQALSADWDDAKRAEILMALGEAHFQAGQPAQASETYRAALTLAQSEAQAPDRQADTVKLALAGSLFPQARFAEAIALAQQVRAVSRPEIAEQAEFIWGAALSLEGADLAGAAEHLKKAEALLRQRPGLPVNPARLAQIKFELGSVAAQQGDLQQAIALYREALDAAREGEGAEDWVRIVLAHNNLAYHLHLLGDPTAIEFARTGVALAQEKGALSLLTYLYSTSGEIALAAHDLEGAEGYFAKGLAFAERFSMPERIAGLTANLGLVAQQRGDTTLAVHRLSTALARADALGTRHLAAQIRIWLAPLLPPVEARAHLAEARAIAESGGRRRLLEDITRLEVEIGG